MQGEPRSSLRRRHPPTTAGESDAHPETRCLTTPPEAGPVGHNSHYIPRRTQVSAFCSGPLTFIVGSLIKVFHYLSNVIIVLSKIGGVFYKVLLFC